MKEHTQLSKFYFPIKTEDPNRHKKYIKQQRLKELATTKNVDVNSNISENKDSMARITQSRWIALFLLWSFNKSKIGQKKYVEIFI